MLGLFDSVKSGGAGGRVSKFSDGRVSEADVPWGALRGWQTWNWALGPRLLGALGGSWVSSGSWNPRLVEDQ